MFIGLHSRIIFILNALNLVQLNEAHVEIVDPDAPKNRTLDDVTSFNFNTYCKFQKNENKCRGIYTERRFYYDINLNECVTFDYGGCNNTFNMFSTVSECKDTCVARAHVPAFVNVTENVYCLFQPDFGRCQSYYPKWYYDVSENKCQGFSYSGCEGNINRFSTATECLAVCHDAVKSF